MRSLPSQKFVSPGTRPNGGAGGWRDKSSETGDPKCVNPDNHVTRVEHTGLGAPSGVEVQGCRTREVHVLTDSCRQFHSSRILTSLNILVPSQPSVKVGVCIEVGVGDDWLHRGSLG